MIDFSISWGYIVEKMESQYSIPPDSKEKVAFSLIEKHIHDIWNEHFENVCKNELEERRSE